MAGTATPIFPQVVKNWAVQILPADTTTVKTLVTGGTNGTKVESIIVSSTDTAAENVILWATISAVAYALATIPIPALSGFTFPSVDVLRSLNIPGLAFDSNGNKYLYVASGTVLGISSAVTITAAKALSTFAQGGDF